MRNPSSTAAMALATAGGSGSRGGKTTPCCSKVGLKRGPWTPEEDELLTNYVKRQGEGRWRTLPKRAGLLRCGKSCRLRWMNYLRPSLKRGHITPDEEELILRLHRLLGNRWSLIAGRIPGRTDNEIKNYWNTHLSKKLISQGIDPRTHKPLNSNPSTDNNNQASSSRANHIYTSHNLHINFPVALEEENSGNQTIADKGDMYHNANCNLNQLNNNGAAEIEGFNANDASEMGWRSNEGLTDEDEDGLNYCNDDSFSTFLNSLINEDVFSCQHHWDTPIIPSGPPLDQNDPQNFNEHIEKQS